MGGFTLANLAQLISFKMRPQLSPCDIGKYEWRRFATFLQQNHRNLAIFYDFKSCLLDVF